MFRERRIVSLIMKPFVVVLTFYFFVGNYSWRILHRGRGKGGLLGEPPINIETFQDEQYFDQKLDHFNAFDSRTWKQRFFENQSFYKAGGPVFLMINGEAEASLTWINTGAWIEYAQKYGAYCVLLEHRFYGKSRPTSDLSTENLAHLSSEQALADVALFITSFEKKRNFKERPKWIVFGGSYAGSLASWMRMKYPHLVNGAVSSSGPLVALPDFKEYFAVVHDSVAAFDPKCVTAIEKGTKQLSKLLDHPLGQKSVFKLFNLCDPIDSNNNEDSSNLYNSLAENFAYAVQYDKLSRHVGNKTMKISIEMVCSKMLDGAIGLEVNRLAAVNSLFLSESGEPCLDYKYEKMIGELRDANWDGKGASGSRQWTYQTCSEFGFFATSDLNATAQMFGSKFPIDFFNKQCSDIFGEKFTPKFVKEATRTTNMMYGGLNNEAVNVVYVHGSTDPWHVLGITRTLDPKAPAIYINGTAHCANMFPSSADDPQRLVRARKEVGKLIGKWLAQ